MEKVYAVFRLIQVVFVGVRKAINAVVDYLNPFPDDETEYWAPEKEEDYTEIIKKNEEAEKFSGE